MSRACLELRLGLLERRTGCESRHELVEPGSASPRHVRRGRQVAYVDMGVPRHPDVVSAGALGSLKAPSSDADNAELAAVYPDCLAEHGGVPVEHVRPEAIADHGHSGPVGRAVISDRLW